MLGFTAIDLTVSCMTEVMWMFVLLDNSLLGMVFDYTLKLILSPVQTQNKFSTHYCSSVTLFSLYIIMCCIRMLTCVSLLFVSS